MLIILISCFFKGTLNLRFFECLKKTVGSMESTGMCVSSDLGRGLRHTSSVQNSHYGSLLNANCNSERGTWRSWSIERSGDPLSNVEGSFPMERLSLFHVLYA